MNFEEKNLPLTSEEIIEECDMWLDLFKQAHDEYKELVLSEKYRKKDVTMELKFPLYPDRSPYNSFLKGISLNLCSYGSLRKSGVYATIKYKNGDIYAYLVANVLDYYLLQNLRDEQIIMYDRYYSEYLYSDSENNETTVPILASLSPLTETKKIDELVFEMISNHNSGESSEQLISNLKNRIYNQQINDNYDFYISRQCDHILKKSLNSKK